jgi:hypothetical protein
MSISRTLFIGGLAMSGRSKKEPNQGQHKATKRGAPKKSYEKPLSLFPLTFDQAVTRIVRAKVKKN